jgi:16S rRNA (uracil1498-N3)-methyltransferase
MSERFFVSTPVAEKEVTLDGPEAHHLIHVMRGAVGDTVTLFDGSGAEFTGIIEKLRRSEVDLRITARRETNRELPFELVLGVALPKGDRQKWLVEKLTELGVTTLVPLDTERGVAQPTSTAIERLNRTVIEAAKQCGRNRLMQVNQPRSWDEWIHDETSNVDNQRRLIAHPGGKPFSQFEWNVRAPCRIAIGPEGGLTDGEVGAAVDAGWQLVDLGQRILRIETAAVVVCAVISLR